MLVWPSFLYTSYFIKCMLYFRRYILVCQLGTRPKLAPKGMQGQMMGLFFASIAMGNLVAAFFGGHVSADKIEGLPTLFTTMTIFLVVTAVVLLALAKPINNMLKKSEHADQVS